MSLDTETTGVDFCHGAKPFLVTTCTPDGEQTFWEWPVDPLTREPDVPVEDVEQIQAVLDAADVVVLQNAKFDAHALAVIGVALPWEKVQDTLMAGHLLATNHRHNLTDMCIEYLGVDIESYEVAVKAAVEHCRKIVRRDRPDWRIAREGDEMMPSVKGGSKRDEDKPWKNDMWLLHALLAEWDRRGLPYGSLPEHAAWSSLCADYANADSSVTVRLWLVMEAELERRELTAIYRERLKLLPIAYDMEQRGITVSGAATDELISAYGSDVDLAQAELHAVADQFGFDLELPNGASPNDSLREFCWGSTRLRCPRCKTETKHKGWLHGPYADGDTTCPKCLARKAKPGPVVVQREIIHNPCLNLEPVISAKTGSPTLDKDAMDHYVTTLPPCPALDFFKTMRGMRAKQTSITAMESYKRFWIPHEYSPGYYVLHPNLNPCGTDHLRWASYNPNGQNFSKKEYECEECDGDGCDACGGTGKTMRSMRYILQPAPGREWWSMDYENIERRIPAFESGEPKMVAVFERPNEPPYWGSLYCLTASVLYPDEYWPRSKVKGLFRKERPQLYKQSKFFDLAKQYGCGRRKGDLLSKVRGSFDIIDGEFPLLTKLQQHYLSFARRYGYVQTLPDRTVDPSRGYPILASRTEDGDVLSTTPFNYHTSGTACWIKNKALVRCSERIREWNAEGWDGFIALEVHDEILFDMPAGIGDEPWLTNLPKARELARLMASCGEDVGIPTPTTVEYHRDTWAAGIAL